MPQGDKKNKLKFIGLNLLVLNIQCHKVSTNQIIMTMNNTITTKYLHINKEWRTVTKKQIVRTQLKSIKSSIDQLK